MLGSDKMKNVISEAGITPPSEIIPDGQIHRFSTNGDTSGEKSGWYVFYADDPPAGAFGDWRKGISHTWSAVDTDSMTGEQRMRYQQRIEQAKREREQQIKQERADAANRAKAIWNEAEPAPATHPYLQKKQVQSHGLRIHKDMLVCPVYINGQLRSLQFITADSKRFLKNGEISGGYYPIGTPEDKVFVCEGFATAATVREVTGEAVVVAYNAKNLIKVAKYVRETKPNLQSIIAGDNDRFTEGNPGEQAAKEAADAVNGTFILPEFPDGVDGTDFNDLYCTVGSEAVTTQLSECEQRDADPQLTDFLPDGDTIQSATVKQLAYAGAEYLHHTDKFLAILSDFDADLYTYHDGIWTPRGDQGVREILRPLLKDKYTTHLRREVVDQLKGLNPVERDRMGTPDHTVAVANGLLNLNTQELRPLHPEDHALWKMDTAYNPDATCDLWLQTLEEIVHPEHATEYIQTLQEFLGSMLSPRLVPLKQHILILGPADAGKSIVVLVVKALFGDRNVATESIYELCNTRWGVASLYGKPVNVRNDLDANIIKNAARWKELTSPEDPISAERKNQNKFSFTPATKFLFTANQAPKSSEADKAFWRRWITLVFPRSIPESEQNPHLLQQLTTPEMRSGILNWALAGLDRLRRNERFTYFPGPQETQKIWTQFGGTIEQFADQELWITGDYNDYEDTESVYEAYKAFARGQNKEIESKNQFTRTLQSLGFVRRGQNTINGKVTETYQGVRFQSHTSSTQQPEHTSEAGAWIE